MILVSFMAQGFSAFTGGFHKMESATEKSVRVEKGEHKKDDRIGR